MAVDSREVDRGEKVVAVDALLHYSGKPHRFEAYWLIAMSESFY